MNEVRCPRCGGSNPPNAAFCSTCGAPLTIQQPTSVPPPVPPPNPGYSPPPPNPGYYPSQQAPAPKVMGDNTKWALGLGLAALFCCGPITGVVGLILAKKDMDEIAAGRAPQLDANWAKWAYYLNIVGLILFVAGLCLVWGVGGLRSF
jgi:hypothetical protein